MAGKEGLQSQQVMSERERRRGLNEAVFRQVNERIRDLHEEFKLEPSSIDLMCECDDTGCMDRISMTVADYEQLRADSTRFVIVPGHTDTTVEVVVAHTKEYDLVQKRGEAAAIADETDPREP